MSKTIDQKALDQLFFDARSHNEWLDKDVPDALLVALIDTLKMAPTSANCSPGRFIFVKSQKAKERLKPHLSAGNQEKTMRAPVCAIIGTDREFFEHLPRLFPHADARSWFDNKPDHAARTAVRNGTLQGAYLIIAARALGLDAGPMSGFDNEAVDEEFFSGTTVNSNFLCNLGYGDEAKLFPRSPRFSFADIAEII